MQNHFYHFKVVVPKKKKLQEDCKIYIKIKAANIYDYLNNNKNILKIHTIPIQVVKYMGKIFIARINSMQNSK